MTDISKITKSNEVNLLKDDPQPQERDLYTYLFQLLMEGLDIQQQSFSSQSDNLDENAARQKAKLDEQTQYTYKQLPANPTQKDMDDVTAYNKNIDALKASCQNTVSVLKQSASVEMSRSKVAVDNMSQKGSMTSAFIKSLDTIVRAITDMAGTR